MLRHALRNALLPVITVAGMQFGSLLAGAIVIEKVFARPGIGTLLLEAICERDYPVVQGCVLVIARHLRARSTCSSTSPTASPTRGSGVR